MDEASLKLMSRGCFVPKSKNNKKLDHSSQNQNVSLHDRVSELLTSGYKRAIDSLRRVAGGTNLDQEQDTSGSYESESFSKADADYIDELDEHSHKCEDFSPLEELSYEAAESTSSEYTHTLGSSLPREVRVSTHENDNNPFVRTYTSGEGCTFPADFGEKKNDLNETDGYCTQVEDLFINESETSQFAVVTSPDDEQFENLEAIGSAFELPSSGIGSFDTAGSDCDFYDDLDELFASDIIEYDLSDDLGIEELNWDDLDYLDEEAVRENRDKEIKLFGVEREERARQIAVEVLDRVGWHRQHLELLESIFIESGWSAARVAIEKQISLGALPEEIILAKKIRSIWSNNEHFWTVFRMRSNAPYRQAEAIYSNFSWVDAFSLLRCFPAVPDESEVIVFLDELFEEWYLSSNLRRHFCSFLKYLRYRVGKGRHSLPGEIGWLFSSFEGSTAVESIDLLSETSETSIKLNQLSN